MSQLLELSKNISEKLHLLEDGKLNEAGLNEAIKACSKLQEALYILRFKGYEEKEESHTKREENIQLNFGTVSSNQISLIDAIEEAQIHIAPEHISDNEVLESGIKWEANEPKKETAKTSQTAVKEKTAENPTEITPKQAPVIEKQKAVEDPNLSLNEQLNQDVNQQRLGEKLQQSAIKDLRSAISINQRFLFINGLFDGKTEIFQEALEHLETASSRREAKNIENELFKKHAWDDDNKTVQAFSNLIDRRYP